MRYVSIILLAFLLSGCGIFLSKEQRKNKKANRKLERLIERYPDLVSEDTLRDTVQVVVPEIRIDTVFEISKDVSGVDSILLGFNDKIDSLTALKLGNEIKYYITNRAVIEDTIYHEEDGIKIKIWQEGAVLRFTIDKPQEIIEKPVAIPFNKIAKIEENWFEKAVQFANKFGFLTILILIIIWGIKKLFSTFVKKG